MVVPSSSSHVTLSLLIKTTTKEEFIEEVDNILSDPPFWIKDCVKKVRDHLNRVPNNLTGAFNYCPRYKSEKVAFTFFCTVNLYMLNFEKIDKPPLMRTTSGHKAIDDFVEFIRKTNS